MVEPDNQNPTPEERAAAAEALAAGAVARYRELVASAPDLVPGMEVQLMRRSLDFEYVARRTRELLARASGRWPRFALYIDCAGRAGAYCGEDREEAAEVRRALGDEIPLLGFYSGIEIAAVAGTVQPLDWTGVLCLFSEA